MYAIRSYYVIVLLGLFCSITCNALAMHHAVKVADKAGVGQYLTDTEGKTLYWFKKDAPGSSACAGPCVEKWPVFYRETVKAPEGVDAADFATITRADGQMQTTFRGYRITSYNVCYTKLLRTSLTPCMTAEKETKLLRVELAMTRARVVFPVPGGPQKMTEVSWSLSIRRLRSFPSPRR